MAQRVSKGAGLPADSLVKYGSPNPKLDAKRERVLKKVRKEEQQRRRESVKRNRRRMGIVEKSA